MDGQDAVKKPWYQVVDGYTIPGGFSADNLRSAMKHKAQDDDIFIVTYAKSGTTWMQMILLLLKHEGVLPEQFTLFQLFHDYIPFIDMFWKN